MMLTLSIESMKRIKECEDCGFEYTVRSEPDFNKCIDCQIAEDNEIEQAEERERQIMIRQCNSERWI